MRSCRTRSNDTLVLVHTSSDVDHPRSSEPDVYPGLFGSSSNQAFGFEPKRILVVLPRIPPIGRRPQWSTVSTPRLKGNSVPIEPRVDGPRTVPTLRSAPTWPRHT
eukprot:scaffold431_cov334-Pavlova_lutheri.AAC.61